MGITLRFPSSPEKPPSILESEAVPGVRESFKKIVFWLIVILLFLSGKTLWAFGLLAMGWMVSKFNFSDNPMKAWKKAAFFKDLRYEAVNESPYGVISGDAKGGVSINVSVHTRGGSSHETQYRVHFPSPLPFCLYATKVLNRSDAEYKRFEAQVPSPVIFIPDNIDLRANLELLTNDADTLKAYLTPERIEAFSNLIDSFHQVMITHQGIRVRVTGIVSSEDGLCDDIDFLVEITNTLRFLPSKTVKSALETEPRTVLKFDPVPESELSGNAPFPEIKPLPEVAPLKETAFPEISPLPPVEVLTPLSGSDTTAALPPNCVTVEKLAEALLFNGLVSDALLSSAIGQTVNFTDTVERAESVYQVGKGSIPALIFDLFETTNRFGTVEKVRASVILPEAWNLEKARTLTGQPIAVSGILTKSERLLRVLYIQAQTIRKIEE